MIPLPIDHTLPSKASKMYKNAKRTRKTKGIYGEICQSQKKLPAGKEEPLEAGHFFAILK